MSSRYSGSLTALFLCAALGLTACSGAQAGNEGTPSVAPTVSQSPAPIYKPASAEGPAENVPVPQLPEVGTTNTNEGLQAFIRYWYGLFDYAYESGDTKPIREITGPECKRCDAVFKTVEERHASGGWYVGGRFDIQGMSDSDAPGSPGVQSMQVHKIIRAVQIFDGAGNPQGSKPDLAPSLDVAIAEFSHNRWHVIDVGTVAGQ